MNGVIDVAVELASFPALALIAPALWALDDLWPDRQDIGVRTVDPMHAFPIAPLIAAALFILLNVHSRSLLVTTLFYFILWELGISSWAAA